MFICSFSIGLNIGFKFWLIANSLQGQDIGQITSVPDHCDFFLYSQTFICNYTCLYIQ